MGLQKKAVLLVSYDAEWCDLARREFETREEGVRVTCVRSIDAAVRVIENAVPSVILLDETLHSNPGNENRGLHAPLNATVSALAVYAPVIVIGAEEHESQIAALVNAGAADFVPRGRASVPIALGLIQRRLHQAEHLVTQAKAVMTDHAQNDERFGEVLRHELNNPLTGILGNAELLLAEVRRKSDGRMPQGGQQRLETIAALAVRLRETVRRLSLEWETRQNVAQ